MLTRRLALAACFGLAVVPGAFAQPLGVPAPIVPGGPPPPLPGPGGVAPMPPGGIAPRPPRPPRLEIEEEEGISERQAVRIARRRGMVEVERVRRGRDVWIVTGTDGYGDDMRIVIGDDGEVLDIRRD
ncbi:MAG: hypothetical protein ABS59_22555 [Methylobacterium sp. SCN 67-24]|nr:MAG: hypothetical protein ABS59_22555 [Methylobacterium sp. SCN 67-24]